MKSMIYLDAAGVDSDSSHERWAGSADKIARPLPGRVARPTRDAKRRVPKLPER